MPSVMNAGQASIDLGSRARGPGKDIPRPKDGPSVLNLLGYASSATETPSGTPGSFRTRACHVSSGRLHVARRRARESLTSSSIGRGRPGPPSPKANRSTCPTGRRPSDKTKRERGVHFVRRRRGGQRRGVLAARVSLVESESVRGFRLVSWLPGEFPRSPPPEVL